MRPPQKPPLSSPRPRPIGNVPGPSAANFATARARQASDLPPVARIKYAILNAIPNVVVIVVVAAWAASILLLPWPRGGCAANPAMTRSRTTSAPLAAAPSAAMATATK